MTEETSISLTANRNQYQTVFRINIDELWALIDQNVAMESEIKSFLPTIDPVLSEYSVGYLTHAANMHVPDSDAGGPTPLAEAATSITALLVSASGESSPENEAKISQLVEKWVEKFSAVPSGQRTHMSSAARRLDQAIQVGAQRNMSSTLGVSTGGVDLESANTRKLESKVDRKKLEKAERKIAAKQSKKVFKAVEYEASRLLNQPDDAQSYEEFFMAVNPLQLGSNAQGQAKSKDIKLDGIDVSIGGLRILTDTTLTLAYGRRYGLVGQNGIGKSTLLRALARRELAIPTHISILHVEQEVICRHLAAGSILTDYCSDYWRRHTCFTSRVGCRRVAKAFTGRTSRTLSFKLCLSFIYTTWI